MSPGQAWTVAGGVPCSGPFAGAARSSVSQEVTVAYRAVLRSAANTSGGLSPLNDDGGVPPGVWGRAAYGSGCGQASIFPQRVRYRQGFRLQGGTPCPDPHGLCESGAMAMMEAGDRLRVSRDAVPMWLRPWSPCFFSPPPGVHRSPTPSAIRFHPCCVVFCRLC